MSSSSEPIPETEQDPAAALMREVGAQLRQVREERGEDLEAVGDALRIKPVYLQAIETGDLSVMPGRAYALGFLRSYADHLGFDGDDLIEQIRSIVEDLTDRTRLEMKTPLHESRVPKAPVIALSVAMLAGVYVGWTFLQGSGEQPDEVIAEVPENLKSIAVGALPEASPTEPSAERAGAAATLADPAGARTGSETTPPADDVDIAATEPPGQAGPGAAEDAPDLASPPSADVGAATGARAAGEAPPVDAPPVEAGRAEAVEAPSGLVPSELAPTDPRQRPGAVDEAPPIEPEPDRALAEVAPQAGPEPAAGPIEPAPAAPPAERAGTGPTEPEPAAPVPELETGSAPPQLAAEAQPAEPDPGPAAPDEVARRTASGPTEEVIEPDDERVAPPETSPELPAAEAVPAAAPAGPATAAQVVAELRGTTDAIVASRPPEAGPPRVMEQVNQDARVVLHALDTTWIRIASESGNYLRTRTLEAGDIFLVPNRDDLELWTGNAGGIEIVVDGQPIPPLGGEGAVLRDVSLDPSALRPPGAAAG